MAFIYFDTALNKDYDGVFEPDYKILKKVHAVYGWISLKFKLYVKNPKKPFIYAIAVLRYIRVTKLPINIFDTKNRVKRSI